MVTAVEPFKVLAPATSANLGPGFDCLGLALDIWNVVEVAPGAPSAGRPLVEVVGEGAGELDSDEKNLVYRAMTFLAQEAVKPLPAVRLRCLNEIPLKRGMGSSAAAIAGGLVAANHLLGGPFAPAELLEMAATIEGHPDNVAGAVLGGLQLIVREERKLFTAPIPTPPDLSAVLFVPDFRIATADARAVLPKQIPMEDAVFNMGRVALLALGMATNKLEYLGLGTDDRLHQPYRRALFPAMRVIFKAARDAGAACVFLSGSGSTILALTRGKEMTVAYEMAEAARQAQVEGKVRVAGITQQGARVA